MKGQGRRFTWIIAVVVILVAVLDQVLKAVVLQTLEPGEVHPVIGEWLSLRLIFNPGAAFGMGQNATWIFTCVQLIFVIGVAIAAPRITDRATALGLALIGGGALGNLTDRLTRQPQFFFGHVVDYISVKGFAVFNLADAAITIGVVIFVLATFLGERGSNENKNTVDDAHA